jgi:hypothetical protein
VNQFVKNQRRAITSRGIASAITTKRHGMCEALRARCGRLLLLE